MSPNRFDYLLDLVQLLITKEKTDFRDPILAAESLILTLRYLASGKSQQLLSFSYCMGKSIVSMVIGEICDAHCTKNEVFHSGFLQ